MSDRIGKRTARLMSALEGKKITQGQFHIIAHPDLYDRSDSQAELDKLHSRGLTSMELSNDSYLHTLSPKGQHVLDEYRKYL